MNVSALNNLDSLQFMPVKGNKLPIAKGWQKNKQRYDLSNCEAVGLVCGMLSLGVEALDIDLKYDLTGKLFDRYKRIIHEIDPTLLQKLVVQKTKSGGYHFIYRCAKVEGNLKLANRPTTDEEKKLTYTETLNAAIKEKKSEAEAIEKATKAAINDKIRVLIETRGEGGYIMCHPSKGYDLVHGEFNSIAEITIDQRETLHNIARQFNQVVEQYSPKINQGRKQKGQTPFEDYNDRADVIGLLEKYGWRQVRKSGSKTYFLRPGQTSAATSGDYDQDKNWFAVFTTSSQFEPQKAYLPYAVYAMLECDGNFSKAAKELYDLGYGDRIEKQQEVNQKTPSKISLIDDDFSFVATSTDYETYLQQAKDGTLPKGLSTGMPSLDKHFLFKNGAFVIINGIDNVGKTACILFLSLLSALMHDWYWIIFCAENSVGYCVRKLMEFYWNKPINRMNDVEFKMAKKFVEQHFTFIKSEDELYNYKDILMMTKKLMTKRRYDSVLLDPYNALKIELTNASKLSTHEYHYEAISEIKLFTKQTGMSFYINTHAVTAASRLRSDDKKSVLAPQKGDVEGGAKFANKADDFLTIHRDVQHPQDWMVTEIHVRKIKETETGGQVTPFNNPVRIRMMKGGCSFCEDNGGVEISPIEKWHRDNKQQEITYIEPIKSRLFGNHYLDSLPENEDPF